MSGADKLLEPVRAEIVQSHLPDQRQSTYRCQVVTIYDPFDEVQLSFPTFLKAHPR